MNLRDLTLLWIGRAMPVRVVYRPLDDIRGFVFDTPRGTTLVLDPSLSPHEQRTLAAELLDDDEITEILISLEAVPA